MKALIDQLPTLLGVVVGAIGAMASSSLTDRMRWRRDQAVRWDQRRLDAYVAFTATLKDVVRICFRVTAPRRPGTATIPVDRESAIDVLEDAERRNSKDWESLLLLGDAETVDAARRWRKTAGVLARLSMSDDWNAEQWRAAVHSLDQARDEFHLAARRALGVTGGSVEQFAFLREQHGDASPLQTDGPGRDVRSRPGAG